jgi:hypothetical protein
MYLILLITGPSEKKKLESENHQLWPFEGEKSQ